MAGLGFRPAGYVVNGLVRSCPRSMVEPMSLAESQHSPGNPGLIRNDWTRAEVAALFALPFPDLMFEAARIHRHAFRSGRGADLDAAVDQDRRLPGGLRLLPAGGALRHRRQGREADGARRRAGRGRARPRRAAPAASAWAPPGARRRTATSRMSAPWSRASRRWGSRPARRSACSRRRRPAASSRAASTTTTTTSTPRRSSTARSSPPAPTRIGSTRSTRCATPASMSAAAASSAWARARTTAPACSPRSQACRSIRKACRSTCWCRSRARRSPGERSSIRWSSCAPSRSPASACRSRWCGSRAGREDMSEETQALCFLAGANSIFYGPKLLTTPNPAATATWRCSTSSACVRWSA